MPPRRSGGPMVAKKPQSPKGVYRGPFGPVGALPPPAAPPPAAPEAGGPPVDPAFEAEKARGQRTIGLGQATDAYQMRRIENEYGFGSDTSNPFSQAALLSESFKRNQRGTGTSYAAQGQFYSGAHQSALDEDRRQYDISKDRAMRDYEGAKGNILIGAAERYSNVLGGVDDAQLEALLRAIGGAK